MFVWSKKLVVALLSTFALLSGVFFFQGSPDDTSGLKIHTTRWITLNYTGLLVWLFVWMIDQARVRGKNVWLWLLPCFSSSAACLRSKQKTTRFQTAGEGAWARSFWSRSILCLSRQTAQSPGRAITNVNQ